MNDRHPKDPRNDPRHRERGPRRWSYTYEDIATAAGLARGTVIAYAHRRRFDPTDLQSVAAFIAKHQRQK